jgi:hypothetical protein
MNLKETLAIAEQMQKDAGKAYEDGIRYALGYLADLYESIEETDIWQEYMEAGKN